MNPTTERAMKQTVQVFPDAENSASVVTSMHIERGPTLPRWGSRAREWALRRWYRHEYNWLVQGAFAGLINKLLATEWEITGPKTGVNRARYFQDIFRNMGFNEGWDVEWSKIWLDFLRQDNGAYFEIIGPGNPLKPLTGAITGIAHLDSLRCYPTGDPEYPVIYYDRDGKKHKLHADRVEHLVDMPDGDEFNPGYGLCALSRVIAHAEQLFYMTRYNREKLDELPAPGFASLLNMTTQQFEDAVQQFVARKSRDEPAIYGNLVLLPGMVKDSAPAIAITSFSQAPDKYDYAAWVNVLYDAVALGIGMDRQELAQLSGGNLGSGQQSVILHEKSQAKIYGHMLSLSTRKLNNTLPLSCEFKYKPQDAHASKSEADNASTWATFAKSIEGVSTPEERRRLLVNKVESFKDVTTDESGKYVRLTDADPQPEGEIVADGAAPLAVQAGGEADTANAQVLPLTRVKDFAATREAFSAAFTDLVKAALGDDLNRRRAGTVLRANLNRFGKQSRLDGLKQGGVEALSEDDLDAHAVWLAKQSAFATKFLDEVFADGLTDAEIASRAVAWSNKSLGLAYDEGVQSADANGLYEFDGDDGEENCPTCKRLKGQKHRMKDWARKELRPGVDTAKFDCGGFACRHYLKKTTGRASGKW